LVADVAHGEIVRNVANSGQLVNRIVHVGADLVAVIHSVLCEGLTPPIFD
jgi:hypothetical protein